MADTTQSTTQSTTKPEPDTTVQVEDELLVEEVSIDGMCGVY